MEEQKEYEVVETTLENQSEKVKFTENLPNSGLVLTLGILSIPCCCCFFFGLPLGIIAWVMGQKGISEYKRNPDLYTRSSYSNMNAGKICAIVGVVLGVLYLVMNIYSIMQAGGLDAVMEQYQQALEQYQ